MPEQPTTLDEYFTTTRRSQASLAEELGITPGHLSLIRSGQRTPSLELAARIAKACRISMESLLPADPAVAKSAPTADEAA